MLRDQLQNVLLGACLRTMAYQRAQVRAASARVLDGAGCAHGNVLEQSCGDKHTVFIVSGRYTRQVSASASPCAAPKLDMPLLTNSHLAEGPPQCSVSKRAEGATRAWGELSDHCARQHDRLGEASTEARVQNTRPRAYLCFLRRSRVFVPNAPVRIQETET